MKKNILVATIGVVIILGVVALMTNKKPQVQTSGKIPVTASFYPLYFFAQQIGGDKAEVTSITPAAAEPHDYEPTPQDVVKLNSSKLVILNGAGLEAWGDKVKPDLQSNHVNIVTATDGISLLNNPDPEEAKNSPLDPHAWVNPLTAKTEVDNILAGFEKVDPANKTFYDSNANALKQKLDTLDQQYRSGLVNCQQKSFVTSHAAFGYLAKEYSLTQIPIAGLSPDAEPSAQQVAQITDFAKKNNIKYIFFEALVNPKLSQTIATEVGAQTMVLDPIEGLTDDEVKTGKTYFDIESQNLQNLRIVLQCQ
jgi:zinc transport system substrate-binding protein